MCLAPARLVGENTVSRAGRLEVNFNGLWGTVCDDSFDNNDAKVACYMLGYGYSDCIVLQSGSIRCLEERSNNILHITSSNTVHFSKFFIVTITGKFAVKRNLICNMLKRTLNITFHPKCLALLNRKILMSQK